jgi:hypothetical protein
MATAGITNTYNLRQANKVISPPTAQQPPVGQGLLITEALLSHSDTPHSVGLLWTSDQPDAQTSNQQNTIITIDRHPYPRRDSNPQSQQASSRRSTPQETWPLGLATEKISVVFFHVVYNSALRLASRFCSFSLHTEITLCNSKKKDLVVEIG